MSSEGVAPQTNAVFYLLCQAHSLCPEQNSKHSICITWVFLKICKADDRQIGRVKRDRKQAS